MQIQDGVEYALLSPCELVYMRKRKDILLLFTVDGDHASQLRSRTHQL